MEALLLRLDIYTLMLMALFGYSLGFLTLTLTWLAHRDIPGTLLWWASGLLAVIGQSGFVMQILAPFTAGLWAGNVFLITHVALTLAGVRCFFLRPVRWLVWWCGVLLFAAMMGWAFAVNLNVEYRIAISSLAFIFLSLLTIWQLVRDGWRDYRLAVTMMIGLFALLITFTLLRLALLGIEEVGSPFRRQLVNVLPYVTMLMGGYLSSIGVLLLCTRHRPLALRELATRDPLTGVFNRRGLHHMLGRWLGQERVALLMLDLDDFKQLNDRHGHELGDRVLQKVGRYLNERSDLVVGRFGGEEFVVLARWADEAAARNGCERLRHDIAAIEVDGVSITVSVGMDWMAPGEALSQALQRADQALYRAKREGKNRITLFETAVMPTAR